MSRNQRAFTLIELMIVVAIIGILAAIAIPMYLDYTIRSQVAEGLNLTGSAKTAVSEFYMNSGVFPANNAQAGLEASGNIAGKYVASVNVAGAVITIQYGNDANVQIVGETVTLTANNAAAGSVNWVCASGGVIPDKNLPVACR
jgi:type IV pilus assembly protein PilA